jgi:hypothetical protein
MITNEYTFNITIRGFQDKEMTDTLHRLFSKQTVSLHELADLIPGLMKREYIITGYDAKMVPHEALPDHQVLKIDCNIIA